MLSKPVNGWTTVSIKDFQAEASYLVDIPFQWLNACLSGFRYEDTETDFQRRRVELSKLIQEVENAIKTEKGEFYSI